MRKLKLIWDFRGVTGLGTAKHHCIHLKEFAEAEKLNYHLIDHSEVNEMWATAFIVVDETDMKTYRDALKPHRGEVFEDISNQL
ncbi:hypothetical protein [Wenyingzhuangia sp. 2_MG-2023]|uniref:hypothetical protein n=1 Tax=Wenyingzhuangia sp. 2_MG-2023 TaxID=3062639 RepID=UPI0026E12E66|nr:hypothetical protein [Wenyingzhuangia sp. 2_MG-2023]MDO6738389.1 hypothetical protein [Wenyingzhuangia sp. 2_MG-2023]MDO6803388.1 hypothetical protein [Wenyingzhuangia sp. 1_MG-2023]